jgi:hypothetical protein
MGFRFRKTGDGLSLQGWDSRYAVLWLHKHRERDSQQRSNATLRIACTISLPVYGFRNTGDGVLSSAAMQPAHFLGYRLARLWLQEHRGRGSQQRSNATCDSLNGFQFVETLRTRLYKRHTVACFFCRAPDLERDDVREALRYVAAS